MASESYDFGTLDRLEADAVGQPGQRRFRLLAWTEVRTACLWLEKEQLQALALTIEQLLVQLNLQPDERKITGPYTEGVSADPVSDFPLRPNLEFQVGRLGIGYDEPRHRFMIVAHDPESDAEAPPTFSCSITQAQVQYLAQRIIAVASAGRPRCPLCGATLNALGQPHACPGANGHSQVALDN
jgi:uncharacterized repeat protein (TIGR03847 family)